MATTRAQRASLFNTLAELMGKEDAETLMQQLPPGGWDTMATKDDLRALGATFTAALAELRVEVTTAIAELRVEVTTAIADLRVDIADALTEAAKERAELVKSQARHLYITVSTIVLAAISIWIALLTVPAGG